MMLRFWLRRNFLRRGLRWLREHTALLGKLLLPSLLPRLPYTASEASIVRDGRELRVVSSDPVTVETNYVDWVAPLLELPNNATSTERAAAIKKLLAENAAGPLHFPAQVYLDSLKNLRGLDVEFVHRCRASRLSPPSESSEPAVLLIYNRRDPSARSH